MALTRSSQLHHVSGLIVGRQIVLAAAELGALEWLEPSHRQVVLAELDLGHADNALAALELIRSIYAPEPRLRLLRGGAEDGDAPSLLTLSRNSETSGGVTVPN